MPTDSLTDSLTGVKCRATSVAKNLFGFATLFLENQQGYWFKKLKMASQPRFKP